MRRTLVVVVSLSLALAGCKAKELLDKADISKDLQKVGTTDLMKQVAEDSYDAPTDGKLTEAQVRMYLKVREHEKKIVAVAKQEAKQHADKAKASGEKSIAGMVAGFKTLGSVADMLTADLRAAKDLGYNTQEYQWVKQQLMEVSAASMSEKMGVAIAGTIETAYAQSKKAMDEAKDETTKQMYAQMLAGYEGQRAQAKKEQADQAAQNPAIAHNRQIAMKFGSDLNAFTDEWAKFSDDQGAQIKKDTKAWEQKIDQVAAEAKKNQQ
ncbi:MAG: hypothetical protein JJE51_13710 [Thermoanaerobaculia bacterium]|nr:hypothetical protein [Thermoanaerobaculia bacterium]